MADIIPREFIDLLLAKIDLVELIHAQIPLQTKSGSNYFARCPFHNEKSASFSVSQPKQFYYCFGCGAHGNAIDFVIQQDHLSFPEAIEALARRAGMEVPRAVGSNKKTDGLPVLFDLMTTVTQYYYEQMRKSQHAILYLKNRDITGVIAQQFLIGYAPNGWSHLLDTFGKTDIERKKLLDAGLVIKKPEGGYYDRFRDRLMFPIHDYRGRIIGFGGRVIDQGEPKYLNSPETSLFQKGHELYGLYQAIKSNRKLERVIIVEGYMDVIALFQHGITYAVATLGTATSSHHLQRLIRYTTEIIFCFDGDEAGRTAAWRAVQVIFPMMQDHLQIRFLFLPDAEDPDSMVRKEGQVAFEKRLETADSLSIFFFQSLSQQCDMNSMEGRARFSSLALSHINGLPKGIFQEILLDELSKRARVDRSQLIQQLAPSDKSGQEMKPSDFVVTQDKLPTPMHFAIALLLQHPDLVAHLSTALPASSLPGYALFLQLVEMIKVNPSISTGALLEQWRGSKEAPTLAKLARWEHHFPEAGVANEFIGILRQLNLLNVDKDINRLLAKAAQAGLSAEEKIELSALITKKKQLAPAES